MPLKQRMQSSTKEVSGMHYALRGKSLSWLVTGIGYKTSEICCFDSSDRDGSPQHFLLINLRLWCIPRQLFHSLSLSRFAPTSGIQSLESVMLFPLRSRHWTLEKCLVARSKMNEIRPFFHSFKTKYRWFGTENAVFKTEKHWFFFRGVGQSA